MATLIFDNASVTVNSVDLSDHVKTATIKYSADAQEDTAMGDDTHSKKGGLFDWSIDLEFYQDYASSKVDATLFSLVGTTFTVIVRPDAGSVSSTNPNFTGTGILTSYQPVGGSVGDLMMAPVTIEAAGTLSRATA
jgi:hypothetical protein